MQVVFHRLYLYSSAHRQGHRVTSPIKGSNPTTGELQSLWTFFFCVAWAIPFERAGDFFVAEKGGLNLEIKSNHLPSGKLT